MEVLGGLVLGFVHWARNSLDATLGRNWVERDRILASSGAIGSWSSSKAKVELNTFVRVTFGMQFCVVCKDDVG